MKMAVATMAVVLCGCALIRPAVHTVNDIARDLCELVAAENVGQLQGFSPAEFCEIHDNAAPFIENVTAAQRTAGDAVGFGHGLD